MDKSQKYDVKYRSQAQNATGNRRIPLIGQSGQRERTGTEISPGEAHAGGVGRERADDRHTRGFRGDGNVLYQDCGGDHRPPRESVRHWSFLTLQPHEPQPARLLCAWDSPGKNTGVGYHALPQGVFPTQGWNPGLLQCTWTLLSSEPPGKPTRYHLPVKTLIIAKGQFYCL